MPKPKLRISQGNSKIGLIPNISLPPAETCRGRRCSADCYARHGQCAGPAAVQAWQSNWQLWKSDHESYFEQLAGHLSRTSKKVFRYHIGGDIPDKAYLLWMKYTAKLFPKITFFCYTKAWYDRPYIREELEEWNPPNLRIWLICWPEHGYHPPTVLPNGLHGRFWTISKSNEAPLRALHCSGHCPSCMKCWTARIGTDLWILKHR